MVKRIFKIVLLLEWALISAFIATAQTQVALPINEPTQETTVSETPQETAVATPPGQEPPLTFPIDIPHIGKIILVGTIDLEKQVFSLSGKPAQNAYEVGPLKIENPSLTLSNTAGLQMEATISLAHRKIARLAVESFNPVQKKIVLSMGLPEPYNVPLTPWKSVQIQTLFLSLSSKEKKVSTKIYLSPDKKDEIEVTFGSETLQDQTKKNVAQITVTNFKLSALLDQLKNTELNNVIMQSGVIKIADPFISNVDHPVAISGRVDFTQLKLNIPGKLSNLAINGVLDKNIGTNLLVALDGALPLIPNFLTISNAQLHLKSGIPSTLVQPQPTVPSTTKTQAATDTEASLTLNGDVTVTLPSPVGEIHTRISSSFKNGKFDTFEGQLNKTFDFQGVIKITEAAIRYVRATELVEIVGKSTVLDQCDIEAHLQTFKETTGPDAGKRVLAFVGKAAQGKMLKPFAGIPGISDLPLARDMEIGNLEFGLDTNKNFKIAGVTKIGGFPSQATLIKTKTATVVKATPTTGWKLTDTISSLKGTPFEKFDFSNIKLTVASADYYDSETNLKIPAGVSFIAGMSLSDGIFANAKKLMGGSVPKELFACGSANKAGMGLTISIPTVVNLGNNTKMENIYLLALYKASAELTMAVKTQIRTRLPKQNNDTLFSGEFDLSIDPKSPSVTIKGTMLGYWENPLGINGVSIGDVAFEIGAALLPAPPFIRPSSVGFTGKLALGDKKILVATKISDSGDEVLLGSLDGKLSLDDLLSIPRKCGVPIPKDDVFSAISIQDVMLKLATLDTTIGEIQFNKGLTIKGQMNVLGAYALVDATVNESGVKIIGAASEVKLGKFLTISRAESRVMGTKYGSTENGPLVELTLTKDKQELYLSGLMELLGSKDQAEIYVGGQGIRFSMGWSPFPHARAKITGISSGSGKDIDFDVKGEFDSDFFEWLNKEVVAGVAKFKEKAKEDITKAQHDVEKINGEISKLDKQINERITKINNLKKIIAQATENARKDVVTARAHVQDAENKVNSLQKQIDELERKLKAEADLHDTMKLYAQYTDQEHKYPLICWNPFSKSDWKKVGKGIVDTANKVGDTLQNAAETTYKGLKYVGEKARYATELGGLYTALGVAKGALEAAKGILKGVEVIAFDPSSIKESAKITALGIEIAGLETGKGVLIASRETANGILEGAKQAAYGLGEAAKFASKAAGELFNVTRATIEMSVNDLFTKGVFPKITMDAKIMGRNMKNMVLQLDIKHPEKLVLDIVKILGKFVGA